MPGFNYGGNSIGGDSQFGNMGSSDLYGDNGAGVGTGGTGGSQGNNNTNTNPIHVSNPAVQQQYLAIQNDQVLRNKLAGMIQAALNMNPTAKLQIESINASGVMSISVTGLSATQAKDIGLGGLVMGIHAGNILVAIGDIDTKHVRTSVSAGNAGNIDSATIVRTPISFFVSLLQDYKVCCQRDIGLVMAKQ